MPKPLENTMQDHMRLHFSSEGMEDGEVLAVYPAATKRKILRHLYLKTLRACPLLKVRWLLPRPPGWLHWLLVQPAEGWRCGWRAPGTSLPKPQVSRALLSPAPLPPLRVLRRAAASSSSTRCWQRCTLMCSCPAWRLSATASTSTSCTSWWRGGSR